jgi:hypothetical protein
LPSDRSSQRRRPLKVNKDGRWITAPQDKILKTTPPDGGAHICAPPPYGTAWEPDHVFCIVMPPVAAWLVTVVLRSVADRLGLLIHVWHAALFALYIIVLSSVVPVIER